MNHFTLSLATGAIAGAVAVLPMVARKAPMRNCCAIFLAYLFAGVIVFYSDLPYLPWWADGMGVTVMLSIPMLFTAAGKERKAAPMTLFNALLFGFLISLAERYLA